MATLPINPTDRQVPGFPIQVLGLRQSFAKCIRRRVSREKLQGLERNRDKQVLPENSTPETSLLPDARGWKSWPRS